MEFLKPLAVVFTSLGLTVSSWFGLVPETRVLMLENRLMDLSSKIEAVEDNVVFGAYNTSGGGSYRLKSSLSSTDTTINLSSFKEPVSNIPYSMAFLNTSIGYGTVEPLTSDKSEFISFSGITQNADGSAQLTGVIRGLTKSPAGLACTASSTLAVRHPAQSIFILSDSPCHLAEYAVKRNDESISGSWSFPYPTASSSPATWGAVTDVITTGTINTDALIVAGTAGETITSGQIVYLNRFDQEWYKASAQQASTSDSVRLGVAQGAGTDGVSISGGVLIAGLDIKNPLSGSTKRVFLSNTAGATSSSAGNVERLLGITKNTGTTGLYFDPYMDFIPDTFATTTFAGNVSFSGSATSTIASSTLSIWVATTTAHSATTTWSKPANLKYIKVRIVGGGGGGGGATDTYTAGGGGGGGGYSEEIIEATRLGSTETIVAGKKGAGSPTTNGSDGGDSRFGYPTSFLSVTGGGGGAGNSAAGSGGAGGTATGGIVNVGGGGGGAPYSNGTSASFGGFAGDTPLGFGGIDRISVSTGGAPGFDGNGYGSGGSGAASANQSADQTGGTGAPGAVIIEEFFY